MSEADQAACARLEFAQEEALRVNGTPRMTTQRNSKDMSNPIWPDTATARHGPNAKGGRDLVAGDIHGHFATLEHALDLLAFDPARDRLFSVGDLVDRGPHSHAALEWMTSERIAPVRGNHDQLMITALGCDDGELRSDGPSQWWDAIGGDWWYRDRDRDSNRWDHEERLAEECGRWLGALRNVPFVRTIESNCARIGIVHTLGPTRTGPGAQASNDWAALETRLDALTREAHGKQPPAPALSMPKAVDDILWGRPEIEREDRNAPDLPAPMQGIDLVITGHTPGRRPRWTRQNVLCIDTGVFVPEYGHLTIAEIQTGTARAHRFAEVEGRRL